LTDAAPPAPAGSAPAEPGSSQPTKRPRWLGRLRGRRWPAAPAWLDLPLRLLGFAVALGLAAYSAVLEAFLTPLYLPQVQARLPVALVVAVAGNLALVWFTVRVTGRGLAVLGPAAVWVAVMMVAASRTTEGDLVLTSNNWVGVGTMVAGSLAFAAGAYALILGRGVWRRRP
jgi:hypothetical protein